jgi:hypothetical protein
LLPDSRHNARLPCVIAATDFGRQSDYMFPHAGGLGSFASRSDCNEEIVMKKILGAILLASVATTALAADLPSRKGAPAPAPVYMPPAFSWSSAKIPETRAFCVHSGIAAYSRLPVFAGDG